MGVGAGLYMCDVVKKSSRSLSYLLMSSCFAQLTLLPNHKIIRFAMLFNRSCTPSVALLVEASTPYVIHVPWTYPIQHLKLRLDRFSRFAQLTAERLYN